MLLLLAEYLQQFHKGFAVFQYLSLRGILGVLTALVLSLWMGPWLIRTLQMRQIGQSVRTDGPQSHLSKSGTPTMGGALILSAISISTLLWADLSNRYVWVVLAVTLLFGAIGWVDDYRKVIEKNSRGLPSRWKYFWQSVFGLGAAVFLYMTAQTPVETTLILPLLKNIEIPLGIGFVVLSYFVIVGSSNAVNLTDGLDGLAIMPTVMVGGGLGIFCYLSGNVNFAEYLLIPYVPGAGENRLLRRADRCRPRLSLVQHLSGSGLHGRCRRAGARRGAGHHRRDRSPGSGAVHHGRRVRDGNPLGDDPGGELQADWQARVSHGADPPPFRTQGLARTPGDRALLDHHCDPGARRPCHPETEVIKSAHRFRPVPHRCRPRQERHVPGSPSGAPGPAVCRR
jgi:hypothetical protein